MNTIKKISPTDVSALADSVSDEVLAKVIAAKQEKKDRLARLESERSWIQTALTERGYKTLREFLVAIGELKMAGETRKSKSTRRTRTRLEPATRLAIIERLKAGKTTDEVMSEFSISDNLVYRIKSASGLSKPRKPKLSSSSPATMEVAA